MATNYSRRRGETITIPVADTGATALGVSLVTARLRQLYPGRSAVGATGSDVANPVITYRPADTTFPVGWLLTLSAAASLAIASGHYQLDLKIDTGSGSFTITEPVILNLMEPA